MPTAELKDLARFVLYLLVGVAAVIAAVAYWNKPPTQPAPIYVNPQTYPHPNVKPTPADPWIPNPNYNPNYPRPGSTGSLDDTGSMEEAK